MAILMDDVGAEDEAKGTSRRTGSEGASAHTGAPPHISGIQYGTRPMEPR